ncbi:MAG: DUF177 domain-containing protein [Deltaproteobacteria bacterium]|nr:DUF177 domain-containing protein [Deltaproteobacteria bacterium]
MKIRLEDITEEPTRKSFAGAAGAVNARLAEGREAVEFRLASDLGVDVTYYRAGDDLYFQGTLDTMVEATCARCLGTYGRPLRAPFEFVLAPSRTLEDREELSADDLALSFYSGPEIDLEPLCSEQAILALPTRALCREDCRGLCPVCGVDRNTENCDCHVVESDPRWAALREWKPRAS